MGNIPVPVTGYEVCHEPGKKVFGAEHHLHRDNVLQFYESGLVNATCFNPKFLLVKVQDQADCVDNNAWWRQWGFDSPNCLMTLIQAGVELTALPGRNATRHMFK